jgi:hypothetical protein
MPNPYKEIASILESRMKKHAANVITGVPCELGTITTSGLKLDNFKHEIIDYLVADWLLKVYFPKFEITGTQEGLKDSLNGAVSGQATFSFDATTIDEVHLELKADLKPGDRVLVIPVNGGNDYVVVTKVVPNA